MARDLSSDELSGNESMLEKDGFKVKDDHSDEAKTEITFD